MQTPGVSKEQAVAFYQKLWRLHIDSRTQASQSQSGNADEDNISESHKPKPSAKSPFQQRIKPGMFIRLSPSVSRIDMNNGDIAMIMSPASAADFNFQSDSDATAAGQGNLSLGEDRQFVCAAVVPSIMTAAYELFVERQGVCKAKDMTAEVLMEYDQATRYYYMDL
jgi:kinesin family protein 2/24